MSRRTPKFKTGDRVIVVRDSDNSKSVHIGKLATVLEEDNVPYIRVDGSLRHTPFYESDLEFPEVYNSPLYKALNEDS